MTSQRSQNLFVKLLAISGLVLATVSVVRLMNRSAPPSTETREVEVERNQKSKEEVHAKPQSGEFESASVAATSGLRSGGHAIPSALKGDALEEARYIAVMEQYRKDPKDVVESLQSAYEESGKAKSYWSESLAFVFLDDLGQKDQGMAWLEKSFLDGNKDKRSINILADLYVETGRGEQAEAFLEKWDDTPSKNLLSAKIFLRLKQYDEAWEVLRQMGRDELDDETSKFLETRMDAP